MNANNEGATSTIEARVKAAKRSVTTSGMRVGRSGAMISTVGIFAIALASQLPNALTTPVRVVGLLAVLFGIVPFMLGWQQAKAGSAFLTALSQPGDVDAVLMEEKALAGDRRSVSVLLGDGRSQSVALPAREAGELFALIKELRPDAQCDVVLGAQRALAAMKP